MPHTTVSRTKACISCIRGKRKCDLRQPSCGRCASRALQCTYPSTRLHATSKQDSHLPATLIAAGGTALPNRCSSILGQCQLESSIPSPLLVCTSTTALDDHTPCNLRSHSGLVDDCAPPDSLLPPATPPDSATHRLDQALTVPDSWQIYERHATVPEQVEDIATLEAAVRDVRDWLRGWVVEGHTPFIHWRTCTERTPLSIVNAYTSCATYFASSETTKDTALRFIAQCAETLIEESMMGKVTPSRRCPLEVHLTRVQALLVYQTIQLYDGDIRSRAQAEKRVPLLTRWAKEMLDCALQSSRYVHAFAPPPPPPPPPPPHHSLLQHDDAEAWHAWILAESVRRTWVTIAVVQNTYFLLKGEEGHCPGHVLFTARRGLWVARSAAAWLAAHRGRDPLFYDHARGSDIFHKATSDQVDDYALWALRCSAGADVVDKWRGQKRKDLTAGWV